MRAFVVLSRVASRLWLLCRERETQKGDWLSCDVQEHYVEMLKEVADYGRDHGPGKKMKLSNGKGRVDRSEEAADCVLLDPRIWAKEANPCVKSSEYNWFKCESDAQFNGFIDVIGQIDPMTYCVENGASVYHPSSWPVAEDVTAPERVSGDKKTKLGFYCVKAYQNCVREYLEFPMSLQVIGDLSVVEWRDVSSPTWKRASVSKKLRIIDEDLWPDDESVVSGLDAKT